MFSLLQNRAIAPILIGMTIIIGVLVLKPLYSEYIEKTTLLSSLENDTSKKQKDYVALLAIKERGNSGSTDDLSLRVKKIWKKWNTSDIMQVVMLNDYTNGGIGNPARISISSISTSEWSRLPSGLSLGNVNIAIQATSIEDIVEYVTYLTTGSEFIFTLDDISLPIDTAPEEGTVATGYGLSLSLGVYHYE